MNYAFQELGQLLCQGLPFILGDGCRGGTLRRESISPRFSERTGGYPGGIRCMRSAGGIRCTGVPGGETIPGRVQEGADAGLVVKGAAGAGAGIGQNARHGPVGGADSQHGMSGS